MKKVLISGYYGFGNTGDEAILETLSAKFSKSGIMAEVLSFNPEKTHNTYDIKAYKRFNLPEIIKAVKGCDAVVSGGGSLFQDVTSSVSLYYYLGIVLIAQLLGKKVYVFSQGIGPITKQFNRKILTRIINKVEAISVRDEISLEELVRMGVNKPEKMLTTDPVFMLEPASEDIGKKILESSGVKLREKLTIGISARSWDSNNDSSAQIAEVVDGLIEEFNANVILFPFQHPKDLEFARRIAEKARNKLYIIEAEYKPSQIMSAIGLMDINIGIRLHALIFSVRMNVPVIGITYDTKIDGFLKSIGLKPICDYGNIQWEPIKNEIQKIINNKDEFLRQIREGKELAEKRAFENLNKLMEAIQNG
ncbi:MAG: polysaccharide pyruvyl transferase CsaB [Ignavibacteriales bacterium]